MVLFWSLVDFRISNSITPPSELKCINDDVNIKSNKNMINVNRPLITFLQVKEASFMYSVKSHQ